MVRQPFENLLRSRRQGRASPTPPSAPLEPHRCRRPRFPARPLGAPPMGPMLSLPIGPPGGNQGAPWERRSAAWARAGPIIPSTRRVFCCAFGGVGESSGVVPLRVRSVVTCQNSMGVSQRRQRKQMRRSLRRWPAVEPAVEPAGAGQHSVSVCDGSPVGCGGLCGVWRGWRSGA